MEEMYGRSISTHFRAPYDFIKFAESQNAKGYHVDKPNNIITTIKDALKANEEGIPALISVLDSGKIIPPGFKDFLEAFKSS
jgi:thiamine pyrophosphate-dependent acetolactate synthase large subunit-like protein